jgi:hypothetical protein
VRYRKTAGKADDADNDDGGEKARARPAPGGAPLRALTNGAGAGSLSTRG